MAGHSEISQAESNGPERARPESVEGRSESKGKSRSAFLNRAKSLLLVTRQPKIPLPPQSADSPFPPKVLNKPKGGFMLWHVYLLRLDHDCIYVGSTNDLERRLVEHRGKTGSRLTGSSRTVELIYSESFTDRSTALKRERQLKGWTRAKKLALAHGAREELRRLAKRRR